MKTINNNVQEGYCSKEIMMLLFNKCFKQLNDRSDVCSHALAIEWIRVNFGIHIFIDFGLGWEAFTIPCGYNGEATTKDLHWNGNKFTTPQEAESAAILYTLQNLIK